MAHIGTPIPMPFKVATPVIAPSITPKTPVVEPQREPVKVGVR